MQSDSTHCHNDEKLTAEFHQSKEGKYITGDFSGKNTAVHTVVANRSNHGSKNKIQNKHWKCRFYAGFIRAGRFFRLIET